MSETISIYAQEATASHRTVYFSMVQTDHYTPYTTGSGLQPTLSYNGSSPTTSGIGKLNPISSPSGLYYATLTQAAVANVGDTIKTFVQGSGSDISQGSMVEVIMPGWNSVVGTWGANTQYPSGSAQQYIGRRFVGLPNMLPKS